MSDNDRELLDRIAPLAAASGESLKLCQDCGIVAAMLRAAMQSDNAAILPRRLPLRLNRYRNWRLKVRIDVALIVPRQIATCI